MRLRRALVGGGVLVILSSITALAFASRRIVAEQSAYSAPSYGPCVPSTLNRSALLTGTAVAASPLPGSYDASPDTQISFAGAPSSQLRDIRVNGSETGSHGGRLRAYSQGDGASFVPSAPFRAGETVTVRGLVKSGSARHPFSYKFVVAHPDALVYEAATHVTRDYNEMQHFQSRPDLQPPVLQVTAHAPNAAQGAIFAAAYAGPGPSGPEIFDDAGNLIWFDRLPSGTAATNLQVQQLGGAPVLTWWQGHIPAQGFGLGEEMIYSSSYRQIGRVHAGNGYKADLHDFHITPRGTALLTVFDPIDCDISSVGGPHGAAVTDSIFQELDLATGLVRREWHSLDHVALSRSYSTATGSSKEWPFDYFHINSIDQLAGAPASGRTLISARNTSALYELSTRTGRVISEIGGRHSSFRLSAGASTAYQHDATVLGDGTISIFDNGAVPKVHPQSRAMIVSLDQRRHTDKMLIEYEHQAPALSSGSQGNMQTLAGGNVFVGWGARAYFSEYSATGQLLYDAHWHGSYQSYRAYRFPWTGSPSQPPAIAASAPAAGKPTTVYASWNGDTRTAAWRVLAGPSAQQLAPVASAPRSGFETTIATPGPEPFVAVQALDGSGAVLGTSRTIAG